MNSSNKKTTWKYWLWKGLLWSALMFFVIGIGFPLYNEETLTYTSLISSILWWLLVGICFAGIMLFITKRKEQKNKDGR